MYLGNTGSLRVTLRTEFKLDYNSDNPIPKKNLEISPGNFIGYYKLSYSNLKV